MTAEYAEVPANKSLRGLKMLSIVVDWLVVLMMVMGMIVFYKCVAIARTTGRERECLTDNTVCSLL